MGHRHSDHTVIVTCAISIHLSISMSNIILKFTIPFVLHVCYIYQCMTSNTLHINVIIMICVGVWET